jgi:TubC N-terminal docking domain
MTVVAELVANLQARGVMLRPSGETLKIRPASRLTREELEILRAHKDEVLTLLHAVPVATSPPPPTSSPAEVARVLGLPLSQLDRMLEVRVTWLPATLWFIPDEAAIEVLVAEGVSRGRIWTAGELLELMATPTMTKTGAQGVALAKLA